MKDKQELLLTLDEAKPYCKTAKIHYATGWTDTYIWDAEGLLKAQLAKADDWYNELLENYKRVKAERARLIDEAKVLNRDRPELVEEIARYISEFKDWDGAREHIKNGWLYKADQILALIPDEKEIRNCLDCAREAIVDAICCEDGLDGGAGQKVIKWITDILGDYDEWIKTHSEAE